MSDEKKRKKKTIYTPPPACPKHSKIPMQLNRINPCVVQWNCRVNECKEVAFQEMPSC